MQHSHSEMQRKHTAMSNCQNEPRKLTSVHACTFYIEFFKTIQKMCCNLAHNIKMCLKFHTARKDAAKQ